LELGQNGSIVVEIKNVINWDKTVAYPGIFSGWGGGLQQIQLRTEGTENGDLEVVTPYSGGSTQLANE
jgi:hypothetical protein